MTAAPPPLPPEDLHVPDAGPAAAAVARTTHLAVGAHADDCELLGLEGILAARAGDGAFGAVVVTDGAGSPRTGRFADLDGPTLAALRVREQRAAADLGRYAFALQLGLPSAAVRGPLHAGLVERLRAVLDAARPAVLYLHDPFDPHATHRGVLRHALAALRALPTDARPARVLGVEVWGALAWVPPGRRVDLPLAGFEPLARALLGAFESQLEGGKRYDEAVVGRLRANATFADSHSVDGAEGVAFALDLAPLLADDAPSLDAYRQAVLAAFRDRQAAVARAAGEAH